MARLTDVQFETFVSEFEYWQREFGMGHYFVQFIQEEMDKDKFATIVHNVGHCRATVRVNIHTDDDLPYEKICKYAKHEAIHLLLAPYVDIAESRYVHWDQMIAAEEELVSKLLMLITKKRVK